MRTNENQYPIWSVTIEVPKLANMEFKFAIRRAGSQQLEWEQLPGGKNRQIQTSSAQTLSIDSQWGLPDRSGMLQPFTNKHLATAAPAVRFSL
jgi:hypothetical protein